MRIDDELLTRAARQAGERLAQETRDDQPEHNFSPAFDKKMDSLLTRARRPAWQRGAVRLAKCAAMFALVAFVGLSACLLSVEAWREQIFSMVEEKFPDHSRITFESASGEAVPRHAFVSYELGYLPDGFTCVEFSQSYAFNYAFYEDGADGSISFDQSRAESIAIGLNTDGADLEPITLNGEPAQFLSNMGMQTVLWVDERYCFMVSSDLPREEVIRLAESVRVKEPAPALPTDYDEDVAAAQGQIVLSPRGNRGLERLDAFLVHYAAGMPDTIELSVFTEQGGVQRKQLRYDGKWIYFYNDESGDPASEQPWIKEERFDGVRRETDESVVRFLLTITHYDDPIEAFRYQ